MAKLDVTQGLDEDAEAPEAALEAVAQPEKSLEVGGMEAVDVKLYAIGDLNTCEHSTKCPLVVLYKAIENGPFIDI